MGTWRFDLQRRTVELDEYARAIYGIEVTRLDSLTFTTTYIHPDDRRVADERALASVQSRRPYVSQNRIIRADGEVRWVEVTGSPVLDARGELVAMMGTVTDITARRELEAKSQQAQRLEAVGQLTAGIAHNFNNMLAAIMPALAIVEQEVPPGSVSLIRGALRATERAADLVSQLMTLAGGNRRQQRTVESAGALVERTVELCRSTFSRAITLRVDLEPGLPAIHVDAGQIEHALLNTLLNARDAVRDVRGEPEVTVRASTVPDPHAASGRAVAIVIEDNGPGVPEALRERVFDPFYTTKEVGSGTGLGLSTAHAILRAHGGSIRCEGDAGSGARFTLMIPAVDATPEPADPPVRATARTHGAVLVVDDEDPVRSAVMTVLLDSGFVVHGAASAEEALSRLAQGGAVDVVLLDVNMPGSSWRSVVGTVRDLYPRTRVVVFTGGAAAPEAIVDGWLAKPAAPDAIIAAIVDAMARPPS
jgi:PAS domain S-box-containing protein